MTRELVDAARTGDRRAFEALVRPLIQPAYGMAFAMLGDRENAEDAVQEGALKAWRAVRLLRAGTETVRPWFFAIVANECRSVRRSRWFSVVRLAVLPERGADRDLAGRADLARALDRLSAADRQLLYLFFSLDLPFEEVGRVLGISHSAAKSRLYRVTRRLRPEIDVQEVYP